MRNTMHQTTRGSFLDAQMFFCHTICASRGQSLSYSPAIVKVL